MTDISERRLAEETFRRLAAIVDSSSDAIISKTLDGIILSWNAGAEQIYGYTAAEVLGKSLALLFPPDRADELPRLLGRLKRGERIAHYETVRVRKDGEKIDVSLTISPITDAQGRIVGASTIARDVTDRKREEQELKRIERALRESEEQFPNDGGVDSATYLDGSSRRTTFLVQPAMVRIHRYDPRADEGRGMAVGARPR